MDCDKILFEEMTNFIHICSCFVQFLLNTKFKNKNNENGKVFYEALVHTKLHHAWDKKIWRHCFKRIYSDYHKLEANNNIINYDKLLKYGKISVVMNCEIFRFWQSFFKSSILGRYYNRNIIIFSKIF